MEAHWHVHLRGGPVLASLSLHLILQSSLIHLSLPTVCDLKRPRRNRTAGGYSISLSFQERPAINIRSSCRIHKHNHISKTVDGFQNTPDAMIRTPPAKTWKCTNTSIFAVGLSSHRRRYTSSFSPRTCFSISLSHSICHYRPLSKSFYVSFYFSTHRSCPPVCDLKRPRHNRKAGGEVSKLKHPRSANQ